MLWMAPEVYTSITERNAPFMTIRKMVRRTMTETEAHRVASAIRSNAQEVCVEAIEQSPKKHTYYVRCRYNGPTFKDEQRLFLHSVRFRVHSLYEWSNLLRLLDRR